MEIIRNHNDTRKFFLEVNNISKYSNIKNSCTNDQEGQVKLGHDKEIL